MSLIIKDLIVVLVISTVVFKLIRPTALLFSTEENFLLRRNVWYVLTCAAFLSPNFWIYTAIAVPTLIISGRRDTNSGALYLFLLHVVPPVSTPIPLLGGSSLLDLSNQLLLSILIIIPAISRLRHSDTGQRIRGMLALDWCLLSYGVLSSILYLHQLAPNGIPYPSTVPDSFRRTLVFLIGEFAPYFLISRLSASRKMMLDTASALLIPCVVISAIAVFEATKGWLLYDVIPANWGLGASFATYLVRDSSLRAMASSGHPLSLGYLLDIAFGVWLALSRYVPSRAASGAVSGLLLLGLLAAYSRGPWACAVIIYFAFVLQKPGTVSSLFKASLSAAAGAVILWLSPLGKKVAAVLPFLGGQVDSFNIDYRQRLWERGWSIIQQNPIFGDQYALGKMQDLRQGQGIVDFVNGYVAELIASGFVGLSLFLFFVGAVLIKTLTASRAIKISDQDFGMLGASLVCCILGTLFLWALGGPDVSVLWALVALGLAYSYLGPPVRKNLPSGSLSTIERRPAEKRRAAIT